MTTLQFLNRNSSGLIDQSKWDEEIFTNRYDDIKNIIDYNADFVTNTAYMETVSEYNVKKCENKNCYCIDINNIEFDIIDKISIKINCSSELYKILFTSYFVSLGLYHNYLVKLIDTSLFNVCLISYLNNHMVEENDNIIDIPIIQFNHYKNGLVCNKIKKLYFSLGNYSKDYFKLIDHNIINDVKIIIHGKKFYDNSIRKKLDYKPIDIYWDRFVYNKSGNIINNIETKYKFISLSLVKYYNINTSDLLTSNDINEWLSSQPEIEGISFQYENNIEWEYDIKYMKKISLFGINTYIIPLYPEFVNINNMIYHLKNSNKGIDPYIEPYKLTIKTNIERDKYDIYITFIGEWVED
jgi:hypothetical protein